MKVMKRDATDVCLREGTWVGLHRLCQPMQLSAVSSGFLSVPVHPETPMEGGSPNTDWTKEQ